MKSHIVSLVFILYPGIAPAISPSDMPAVSQGDLTFWADRAGFAHVNGKVYQEVYLQFLCRDFAFQPEGDIQRADYLLEIDLKGEAGDSPQYEALDGAVRSTLAWEGALRVGVEQNLENQVIVEAFGFFTDPGVYAMRVTVHDPASGKSATSELPLTAPAHGPGELSISDIEFAHRIDRTDAPDKLLKNGLYVVPNVTRAFARELSFYFELYGLSEGPTGIFDLAYALRDTLGNRVAALSSARYKKPGVTCVKTETLDLPDLPSGRYDLEITARDADTGHIAQRSRAFYLSAPRQPGLATDEASLKRYADQIRHIAKKSELDAYRSLSPDDKVAFILQFWKDRDPTPDTPENEFAAEHFHRLHYADEHFPSRPRQRGSDTDKGRIYIRYGPPTDIERSPFSAIGKAYETWTYDHLNYYQFIFLDRFGDGIYEMIHSTMPGERYNPNWRDEQIIGDPADPMTPPSNR